MTREEVLVMYVALVEMLSRLRLAAAREPNNAQLAYGVDLFTDAQLICEVILQGGLIHEEELKHKATELNAFLRTHANMLELGKARDFLP